MKTLASKQEFMRLREKAEKAWDEARCPYRPDLKILCYENRCGYPNGPDCEIWMRHSGYLAQSINGGS